jgi:hypothetical protein
LVHTLIYIISRALASRLVHYSISCTDPTMCVTETADEYFGMVPVLHGKVRRGRSHHVALKASYLAKGSNMPVSGT